LLLPATNALTTDYTPRLDWGPVTLPLGTTFGHYQVQVADNTAFTAPAVDEFGLTDRLVHEFTLATGLNPNTKYYWRVRSYNTAGEYSAWSLVRYFRTAILPPTLQAPADTLSVPTVRPAFDWGDVFGASGYAIQVSKSNTFTPLVLTATITGGTHSQYTPLVNLPVNTILFWRVKANGLNGPSQWSALPAWSFTTPNPPGVPALTFPAINILLSHYNPTMMWYKPTLPTTPGSADFKQYEVQIATDAAFTMNLQTGIVGDYNTPQYLVSPALNPNLKYYWRVRAVDVSNHYSLWSTVRYFRTRLSAPLLSTPTDGDTTIKLLRPPFVWDAVPGATSYTIQVSKNSGFTPLVLTATITGGTNSQYAPLVNLPVHTLLYWKVRANGLNGPSSWSATWRFTINP
jgi:predicted phage tail protein